MSSENETVEYIVKEMREQCIDKEHSPSLWPYLDRIEAAHKREVAELRECLKEALWQRCTIRPTFKCKDCAYENESCSRWRKALEGAKND